MLIFKFTRRVFRILINPGYTIIALILFKINKVKVGSNLKVRGKIKVLVTRFGLMEIGENCRINSGNNFNVIGRQQYTTFWVCGKLQIGNNVGISGVAVICHTSIKIGNNVLIGGNTVIYDTDFHSLNPEVRISNRDKEVAIKEPVVINDNVFIGAHSTILKGVTIGENAVVGACSVVTKDIPANEIWGGNPAKFIKRIEINE